MSVISHRPQGYTKRLTDVLEADIKAASVRADAQTLTRGIGPTTVAAADDPILRKAWEGALAPPGISTKIEKGRMTYQKTFTPNTEEKMFLYQIAAITSDNDGKNARITLEPQYILTKDTQSARDRAVRKLDEDVDLDYTRILVAAFGR